MESERSSVLEEITRAKAKKVEEKASSLRDASIGIADMVEGNTALQKRSETAEQERVSGFPYDLEMASFWKEASTLLQREEDLTKQVIPELKRGLGELQDLYKEEPESIAELVQRAQEEIKNLEEEVAQTPKKEQEIQRKADRRRALNEEMKNAYQNIEKDNIGFAVDTTLQQLEQGGAPLGLNRDELARAVSAELYRRQQERAQEINRKRDTEREQRETAWFDEIERTLEEERRRVEEIIEDKARFLRGETEEGKAFIADVETKYAQIEGLQNKWALREKTKWENERRAADVSRNLEKMFSKEENTLVQIYNEIVASIAKINRLTPEGEAYTLPEYPREGHYAYNAKEPKERMAQRVSEVRERREAFRSDLEKKRSDLLPLLENIRSPQVER